MEIVEEVNEARVYIDALEEGEARMWRKRQLEELEDFRYE